jgi:hypothetical protein
MIRFLAFFAFLIVTLPVGAQPAQAEVYINSGSIYLTAVGLLHLGLPADDVFWTAPHAPWTQRRLWAGENLPADVAIKD